MRLSHLLPRQLSIKIKFVITFLSILSVSMGLMGFILYHQAMQAAIEQGKILMLKDVQQGIDNLTQKVDMVETFSKIIASDPNIQNFLGSPYLGNPAQSKDYVDNIAPILGSIYLQMSYLHSIRIYVNNESLPEFYDGFYHFSRIDPQPTYSSFIQNTSRVEQWRGLHDELDLTPDSGSSMHAKVFSYDQKIFSSRYTDLAGMLEFEVDRDNLFAFLTAKTDPYRGDVFVVDSSGEVISESSGPVSLAEYGLASLPGKGTIDQVMNVNGVRSIVISTPISWLDLRIVGIYPVSPFINGMKHSLFRTFFFLLSAMLLLSLIVYGITSQLLRRMKVLVRAMREVREGSFDVSVPVDSNDEFALIAQSFNTMTYRIHELVETVYKTRIMEKEAELRALESQINPHFLYNTLATISWAARNGKSAEIAKLSNSMAKFYRFVLNKGQSTIRVRDEIEMVRFYGQIQKFRFEDRFDLVYDIDERMLDESIPKNILQPLVENALSHGIDPKRSHGTIIIRAEQDGDKLIFKVIDDGVGMTKERIVELLEGRILNTTGSGYAFNNVMDRLKGYYGEEASITIHSRPGIGTAVIIKITRK